MGRRNPKYKTKKRQREAEKRKKEEEKSKKRNRTATFSEKNFVESAREYKAQQEIILEKIEKGEKLTKEEQETAEFLASIPEKAAEIREKAKNKAFTGKRIPIIEGKDRKIKKKRGWKLKFW